ncbi:ABC transporter substrate-binding protein [Arundinibacter roseus]|uniref:Cobalamin-binding protein n=1 Tax=Arundinibacter roseus TaxID=2070510 RepID=A0A4R4KEN8_9BACT|nr:helical backbone metal receptor [Arundinibacter roseus]TDB65352.1 cobalamin-binding protein [Arundinibacter roseus]
MPLYTDQIGFTTQIDSPPRRIVSLVPSQTELLFDLGLDETVVGITRFCIYPTFKIQDKTQVGGTKNPDLELIRSLKPDLIIANKEENREEDILALKQDFSVWISDVNTLAEATDMIRKLGEILENSSSADWIAERIERQFQAFRESQATSHVPRRVAYMIWQKPWMVAGGNTFIDSMLAEAGFQNAFKDQARYPECSQLDLEAAHPDVIFLSTEPFPFQEKHREQLQALFPQTQVLRVNGELFSWYGSRLLRSPAYFQKVLEQLTLLSSK